MISAVDKNDVAAARYKTDSAFRERVESYIDRSGACWVWQGNCNPQGYGRMSLMVNGRKSSVLIHRMLLLVYHETSAKHLVARHACGRKNCVNPDHLTFGTQKQNVNDLWSTTTSSSFTFEDAERIRKDLAAGVPLLDVAAKYNVKAYTVRRIRDGARWRPSTHDVSARDFTTHVENLDRSAEPLMHAVCGLAEESGEVCKIFNRYFRAGGEISLPNLLEECGDVVFYVTAILANHGMTLQDAMNNNIRKLQERYKV